MESMMALVQKRATTLKNSISTSEKSAAFSREQPHHADHLAAPLEGNGQHRNNALCRKRIRVLDPRVGDTVEDRHGLTTQRLGDTPFRIHRTLVKKSLDSARRKRHRPASQVAAEKPEVAGLEIELIDD